MRRRPADGHRVHLDTRPVPLGILFFPDMAVGTERLIGLARPGGRVALTIWRGDAMQAAGRHHGRAVAAATGTASPDERERGLFDQVDQPVTYGARLTELGLVGVEVVVHAPSPTPVPAPSRYLDSLRADGVTELDATTLIGLDTARG